MNLVTICLYPNTKIELLDDQASSMLDMLCADIGFSIFSGSTSTKRIAKDDNEILLSQNGNLEIYSCLSDALPILRSVLRISPRVGIYYAYAYMIGSYRGLANGLSMIRSFCRTSNLRFGLST